MRTQGKIVLRHVASKSNIGVGPQPQPNASTPASRIQDFMRINPSTFHGTKVDKYPQDFIDEVLKLVDAMGVTRREKAELAAY